MTDTVIPNIICSVAGLPKSGKNHFAYSWPAPIKVYCFNGGASFVAARNFKDKKIDIHNFSLPIVESTEEQWALPVWNEFYQEYNKDIQEGKYKTYIFDTGTEIENFCQQAVLEELQDEADARGKTKKKLSTNEYLARNLRMNALYRRAANAGVNVVSLQYLKGEWVKEKGAERSEPTGNLVVDGWKQTEAQCDLNLWSTTKMVKGKQVMVYTIKSGRFGRDLVEQSYEDTNYDELVALLFGE